MAEAYITVLTNDRYLPGALNVANSLRDLGTQKSLAVLVANVSAESVVLLKTVYDDVINVNAIASSSVQELADLGRPELAATYTKILVWAQEQYSKVIYLDADVLPLQLLDEYFDIDLTVDKPIAAAPDSGWPDIFNSGVFITRPSKAVLEGLLSMIQTLDSPSFDGGDQGLLNEFFLGKWKRLSFTFNVTPTAGYQYVPAFLRFFDDIKIVHFIGLNKPWISRDSSLFASGSFGKGYDVMTSLHSSWWKVFNKHYFGKSAGDIFTIADVASIEDHSMQGEAHLLSLPVLTNQWDELTIDQPEDDDPVDPGVDLKPIFPWEIAERDEAERVFTNSTDFYV